MTQSCPRSRPRSHRLVYRYSSRMMRGIVGKACEKTFPHHFHQVLPVKTTASPQVTVAIACPDNTVVPREYNPWLLEKLGQLVAFQSPVNRSK
ncbi:hypothetical protein TKK_0008777 [Trichogramma kaykai]